jgi:hypothetical protein
MIGQFNIENCDLTEKRFLVKFFLILTSIKREILAWEKAKRPFLLDEGSSLARRGLG